MNVEDRNKSSFEPRFYRDRMGEGRFWSFVICYKDSDLWIGVDKGSFTESIPAFAQDQLIRLRDQLEDYLKQQPEFASSFVPIKVMTGAPEVAIQMADAGELAGTGPMAAVAGAFSEFIGKAIVDEFHVKEIVVENGGDIYLSLKTDLILSVYAGKSALSGKIGVEIPASITPLGVCTSAGTVGPSISFGKADAVMVASLNSAVADAYATAIGNRVKSAQDIDCELDSYDVAPDILSLLIVCEGKMGIRGQFNLKLIR